MARPDDDTTEDTATITHRVTGYGSLTEGGAVTVTVPDTNGVPSFGPATVPDQVYTINTLIPTLTLPEATGGNDKLTYALHGILPDGLSFSEGTRTLSGTPTATAAVTLTYTATDSDTNTAPEDAATLLFTVTVHAPGVVLRPTALTVEEGATTVYTYTVVLRTVPTGAVTVEPTPDASDKITVTGALTFSTTTWDMVQTVTVAARPDDDTTTDTVTIAHGVTGYGSVTAGGEVTVTVTDTNGVPGFGSATVPDQVYTVGTAIMPLTLPEATGGNDDLTYALTGTIPAGLTFTQAARTLTGTATEASAVTLTYTAADSDANTAPEDAATLTFTVTVIA
ncbi:MAG: putative Ig domain-containing protein, partial [Gammaproteobacteria bacterium]|nr:putative Ig domain-containing protein [Gammaproteobacteria bacterium]